MKLETLNSPEFDALSTKAMQFIAGGSDWCQATTAGGTKYDPVDGSILFKYSSDIAYTDGNGNPVGKDYKRV